MTRSSRRRWPVTTSAGETRERTRRRRICCGGCSRNSPERLKRADTATLTLLSRQSDPELLAAAGPLLESLLAREPENPAVLAAAIQYHERSGHATGRRRAPTARESQGVRGRFS